MNNNNKLYDKLKSGELFLMDSNVNTFIPNPNESNYKIGFITRYFVQQRNDKTSPIYEVESNEYNRLLRNDLFINVVIKWRISGPKDTQYNSIGNVIDRGVKESNRVAISLVSDKIPNLKMYLPNLLQFHK